jgi:SAM-dependent methyltransferase
VGFPICNLSIDLTMCQWAQWIPFADDHINAPIAIRKSPMPFSPDQVRRYYDANTHAFVRHGQGGAAIHRAVWGPGVADREQAFHFVDNLIAGEIERFAAQQPAEVLDLGCGVGGTLLYLAQRGGVHGTGVTLSPVQFQAGQQRIADAGLGGAVRIVEGDYCALPLDAGCVDVAYAIESFVHGPSPERFFVEAARVVRPGGLLIVCDDVRLETNDRRATAIVDQFVRGWHVNTLLTPAELGAHASDAGFAHVATTDLTPWLELGRPRDRAMALLAGLSRLAGPIPGLSLRLAPIVGGSALQRALAHGWIAYHFAVFTRSWRR